MPRQILTYLLTYVQHLLDTGLMANERLTNNGRAVRKHGRNEMI